MGQGGKATNQRRKEKKENEQHVRPTSMPSTSLSEIARSTPFTVSLTASVADFWAANEVEKARGAKPEMRGADRMAVLVRKDIVIDCLKCVVENGYRFFFLSIRNLKLGGWN